ncbi:hypothetical protein L798_00692 [Zootermopsis nevadensis]|uniref:Uncharacterized protein n=1 Tax=Zootermopsis nevadensis TaxID=136037 RepID=A0A067QY14_ZOONE|nr:hypothetical protein L798_00692 [Zootermopsis nevadensis]
MDRRAMEEDEDDGKRKDCCMLLHNMDKKTDRLLDSFIRDIGSPDIEVAIEAAKQLRTTAAMKLEGKHTNWYCGVSSNSDC